MITREEAAAYADGDETSLLSKQDLARTVVALYDEIEHLRHDLERYGLKTVGRLDEPLSDRLTAERDAARAEVERLQTELSDAVSEAAWLRYEVDNARAIAPQE